MTLSGHTDRTDSLNAGRRRLLLGVCGALLVVAFAAFVWPTLYRPIAVDLAPWRLQGDVAILSPIAARQNRFTGTVELLSVRGWDRLEMPRGDSPGDSLRELARKYGQGNR